MTIEAENEHLRRLVEELEHIREQWRIDAALRIQNVLSGCTYAEAADLDVGIIMPALAMLRDDADGFPPEVDDDGQPVEPVQVDIDDIIQRAKERVYGG